MKRIIIQGSSRSQGNTHKIVNLLKAELAFDLLDLNQKHIQPFDYDFNNQDDDFPAIIKGIVANYDLIVFATPVYWYSMSGILKNFFDRISDCLKIDKATGRKLRGKKMAMLSCGSDATVIEGLQVPFKESAHYLGMEYLGDVHTWIADDEIEAVVKNRVIQFAKLLC